MGNDSVIRRAEDYPAAFLPVLRTYNPFPADGDGPLRTDQQTQMAADTFPAVQDRFALTVKPDGLMASVITGNLASAASDT